MKQLKYLLQINLSQAEYYSWTHRTHIISFCWTWSLPEPSSSSHLYPLDTSSTLEPESIKRKDLGIQDPEEGLGK